MRQRDKTKRACVRKHLTTPPHCTWRVSLPYIPYTPSTLPLIHRTFLSCFLSSSLLFFLSSSQHGCSEDSIDLVQRLMTVDLRKRACLHEALEHPFFSHALDTASDIAPDTTKDPSKVPSKAHNGNKGRPRDTGYGSVVLSAIAARNKKQGVRMVHTMARGGRKLE